MIGNGTAIGEFIDRITELSTASAERDKAVLLARLRQDRPDATDIDGADVSFYAELVRKEQLAVDAQRVRTYFPFEAVRQVLLDVTGRLFGLEWTPVDRADARTWHEEVATYDVSYGGERIGRIHLDCTPGRQVQARRAVRPRARRDRHAAGGGGARLQLQPRPDGARRGRDALPRVRPHSCTTCSPPHRVVRFSASATEWDFVEAPSQMLESGPGRGRARDVRAQTRPGRRSLRSSSRRCAGWRADDFGKGYDARTQMFHAGAVLRPCTSRDRRPHRAAARAHGALSVFPYLEGTHMQCHFGHLDGYSSPTTRTCGRS